jgi:hypothetical protein
MENYIVLLNELRKKISSEILPQLDHITQQAAIENPWFTKPNVELALNGWVSALEEDKIHKWLSAKKPAKVPRKIGIVAAGNIPLVGLHDFLCVLVAGHSVVFKKSKSDQVLMDYISNLLIGIEPDLKDRILFTDRLNGVDAVIATGSNNTSRYFEYYFSKIPHIIRKNRTSVGILSGNESVAELNALGKDIFSYFGLGCRNISKIYLPQGYDILTLLPILEQFDSVKENNKYMNNYDYHRALLMMNVERFYDTGNLIAIESDRLHSAVSVLYYEYYQDLESVRSNLMTKADQIQCVASNCHIGLNEVSLGQTQYPELWEYADNVDVLEFLLNI